VVRREGRLLLLRKRLLRKRLLDAARAPSEEGARMLYQAARSEGRLLLLRKRLLRKRLLDVARSPSEEEAKMLYQVVSAVSERLFLQLVRRLCIGRRAGVNIALANIILAAGLLEDILVGTHQKKARNI
jgi:hypothetical protein